MFRIVLLLLGACGTLWSVAVLPSFQRTTAARAVTANIIADQRFRPGLLADTLVQIKNGSEPVLLQAELMKSQALISVRISEDLSQRESPEQVDRELEEANHKVKASLSTSPCDPFLWLLLYSIKIARSGFDPSDLDHLAESYVTGPHEGWISLRRSRLALAALPALGETMQQIVVNEFAALVESNFIEEAAIILTTVGWAHRERLTEGLERTDISSRQILAKRLAKENVKLKIPGVESEDRPWR